MRGRRFPRTAEHIYRSKRWKSLRWEVLKRDNFQCVQCGTKRYLQVDHIIPLRDGVSEFECFTMSRLQTLCRACHGKKTRTEVHGPLSPEREAWRELVLKT